MEELLQKKREKELAETKPTFLTKKEREKLAMERLKEKRREEGGRGDGGTVATAHHASSSRFARATSARDVAERQYQRDKSAQSERERQEQLEQFRKQYAGVRDETEKMKKMKQKAERAKYKFQFDWSKEDDASPRRKSFVRRQARREVVVRERDDRWSRREDANGAKS